MSQRPYNAISGEEFKKRILADIDRQLSQDTRFRLHLTYPQVAYNLTLVVVTWPADAGGMTTHAQGRIGTVPEGEPQLQIPPRPEAPEVGTFVTDGESPRPEFRPSVDAALNSMRQPVPTSAPLNPAEEAALLGNTGGRPMARTTRGEPITGGAVSAPRVIDNPDATRRELGLPIPQPTSVPGGPTGSQIVDVVAADIPKPVSPDVF